jgi:hypothetical protein
MQNPNDTLQKNVKEMVAHINDIKQQERKSLEYLKDFTGRLYSELQSIVDLFKESGVEFEIETKRDEVSEGLKSFRFRWNEMWIVLLPASKAAWPVGEEAERFRLTGNYARIVIYMTFDFDNDPATPMGEIYISPTGKWSVFGIAGTRVEDPINDDSIRSLSTSFFQSLTYYLRSSHKPINGESPRLISDLIKAKTKFGFAPIPKDS